MKIFKAQTTTTKFDRGSFYYCEMSGRWIWNYPYGEGQGEYDSCTHIIEMMEDMTGERVTLTPEEI